MISIKLMGPLFSVFDRPTYRKLVPHHLHTLSQMPTEMMETVADGSFAVALSERKWHSVALDEAHEPKINKACKTAIVRPTGTNMPKLSAFLAFRSQLQTNLVQELFSERERANPYKISSPPSKISLRVEDNILQMETSIAQSGLFDPESKQRSLKNFMTGQRATPETTYDMLHFSNR